jgi:hypothetical protein
MVSAIGRRATPRVRAVHYGLLATAAVVVACLFVVLVSLSSFATATGETATLTARANGVLTVADGRTVTVTWTTPDGSATARVVLAADAPKPGTRTQIAYEPGNPGHAVIPGAELLAKADRASSGIVFGILVALLVLVVSAYRLFSRARVFRGPGREVPVRRIRVQRGLLTRSWLETGETPPRWIPVYFDPVLVTLASPSRVVLHGTRLVGAKIDGVRVFPSGPVSAREPHGRRGDNAVRPDEQAFVRAEASLSLRRQLRADAVSVVPAPAVGLFWTFLDGSGFSGWLGATVIAAAAGLWLAALRGSDPT